MPGKSLAARAETLKGIDVPRTAALERIHCGEGEEEGEIEVGAGRDAVAA